MFRKKTAVCNTHGHTIKSNECHSITTHSSKKYLIIASLKTTFSEFSKVGSQNISFPNVKELGCVQIVPCMCVFWQVLRPLCSLEKVATPSCILQCCPFDKCSTERPFLER